MNEKFEALNKVVDIFKRLIKNFADEETIESVEYTTNQIVELRNEIARLLDEDSKYVDNWERLPEDFRSKAKNYLDAFCSEHARKTVYHLRGLIYAGYYTHRPSQLVISGLICLAFLCWYWAALIIILLSNLYTLDDISDDISLDDDPPECRKMMRLLVGLVTLMHYPTINHDAIGVNPLVLSLVLAEVAKLPFYGDDAFNVDLKLFKYACVHTNAGRIPWLFTKRGRNAARELANKLTSRN